MRDYKLRKRVFNSFVDGEKLEKKTSAMTSPVGVDEEGKLWGSGGDEVTYLTVAPTEANTSGKMKFVVLTAEPATYYDGYYYIIVEASSNE